MWWPCFITGGLSCLLVELTDLAKQVEGPTFIDFFNHHDHMWTCVLYFSAVLVIQLSMDGQFTTSQLWIPWSNESSGLVCHVCSFCEHNPCVSSDIVRDPVQFYEGILLLLKSMWFQLGVTHSNFIAWVVVECDGNSSILRTIWKAWILLIALNYFHYLFIY